MIYEAVPIVDEETGEEYRLDGYELIVSGSLEGVESLAELARGLRGIADRLDELAGDGYEFDSPIEDGRAEILKR